MYLFIRIICRRTRQSFEIFSKVRLIVYENNRKTPRKVVNFSVVFYILRHSQYCNNSAWFEDEHLICLHRVLKNMGDVYEDLEEIFPFAKWDRGFLLWKLGVFNCVKYIGA